MVRDRSRFGRLSLVERLRCGIALKLDCGRLNARSSPSEKPVDPASLKKGDLFDVMPPGNWQGRFTETADAHDKKKVTIDVAGGAT